jgi:hypothetical protein
MLASGRPLASDKRPAITPDGIRLNFNSSVCRPAVNVIVRVTFVGHTPFTAAP